MEDQLGSKQLQLIFDLEEPCNSEDQQVRRLYDQEPRAGEPKYIYNQELDEHQCEVMQFGGCYLGRRHLDQIGQIQRTAVEVELLTTEIEGHLNGSTSEELRLPEEQRQDTIANLVPEFHQDSSFETAENGELTAVLDGEEVRAAARRRMAVP